MARKMLSEAIEELCILLEENGDAAIMTEYGDFAVQFLPKDGECDECYMIVEEVK